MRDVQFAAEEYYHVYARGNRGADIFRDQRDRERLMFLLLTMQSHLTTMQVRMLWKSFTRNGWLSPANAGRSLGRKPILDLQELLGTIADERFVNLVNFAFMPNHFHLTVQITQEGGLSRYMQKVLNAYTKYFNQKHDLSGHLFQGPFGAVHVQDNEQILHLSAYIHKNPIALKEWRNKLDQCPWSSLTDYVHENRWGELLQSSIVLDQFKGGKDYKGFIRESVAKEFLNEEQFLDYS